MNRPQFDLNINGAQVASEINRVIGAVEKLNSAFSSAESMVNRFGISVDNATSLLKKFDAQTRSTTLAANKLNALADGMARIDQLSRASGATNFSAEMDVLSKSAQRSLKTLEQTSSDGMTALKKLSDAASKLTGIDTRAFERSGKLIAETVQQANSELKKLEKETRDGAAVLNQIGRGMSGMGATLRDATIPAQNFANTLAELNRIKIDGVSEDVTKAATSLRSIGRAMSDFSQGAKAASAEVGTFEDVLKRVGGSGSVKDFIREMTQAAQTVKTVTTTFGASDIKTTVSQNLGAFADALKKLAAALKFFSEFEEGKLRGVVNLIKGFSDAMKKDLFSEKGANQATRYAGALKLVTDSMGMLDRAVDRLGNFGNLKGFFGGNADVSKFADSVKVTGKQLTELTQSLARLTNLPVKGTQNQLEGIGDGLKKMLKKVSGKSVVEAANAVARFMRALSGLAKVDLQNTDKMSGVFKRMADAIGNMNKVTGKLKNFSDLSTQLRKISSAVASISTRGEGLDSVGKFADALTKIGEAATKLPTRSFATMSDGITKMIKSIKDSPADIDKFANALSKLLDDAGKFAALGKTLGKSIGNEIVEALQSALGGGKLGDALGTELNKQKRRFEGAGDKIGDAIADGLGDNRDIPREGREAGKSVMDAIGAAVRRGSGMFGTLLAASLRTGFNVARGALGGAVRMFANGLWGLMSGAFRAVFRPQAFADALKSAFRFDILLQRLSGGAQVLTFVQGFARDITNALKSPIDAAVEFENQLISITKTLDTSGLSESQAAEFTAQLTSELRNLATAADSPLAGLPNAHAQISEIAAAAGQLGVARDDVVEFAEVIGQMTIATDLTAENAAFAMARLAAITGDDNFQATGAAIVNLGNNFAATENEILEFAQRLAGAGSAAGLDTSGILALSAAMANVGLNAEAGGTAFTEILNKMTIATSGFAAGQQVSGTVAAQGISRQLDTVRAERERVLRDIESAQDRLNRATTTSSRNSALNALERSQAALSELDRALARGENQMTAFANSATVTVGGRIPEELKIMAEVANLSAEEFATAFTTEPEKAIQAFIAGIGELDRSAQIDVFDQLGMDGIRVADTLTRLGGASEDFERAFALAMQGYTEGTALVDEANARFAGTAAQLARIENLARDLQIELGQHLLPAVNRTITRWADLMTGFTMFIKENPEVVKGVLVMARNIATGTAAVVGFGLAVTNAVGVVSALTSFLLSPFAGVTLFTTLAAGAVMMTDSGQALISTLGGIQQQVGALISGFGVVFQTARQYWDFVDRNTVKQDERSALVAERRRLRGLLDDPAAMLGGDIDPADIQYQIDQISARLDPMQVFLSADYLAFIGELETQLRAFSETNAFEFFFGEATEESITLFIQRVYDAIGAFEGVLAPARAVKDAFAAIGEGDISGGFEMLKSNLPALTSAFKDFINEAIQVFIPDATIETLVSDIISQITSALREAVPQVLVEMRNLFPQGSLFDNLFEGAANAAQVLGVLIRSVRNFVTNLQMVGAMTGMFSFERLFGNLRAGDLSAFNAQLRTMLATFSRLSFFALKVATLDILGIFIKDPEQLASVEAFFDTVWDFASATVPALLDAFGNIASAVGGSVGRLFAELGKLFAGEEGSSPFSGLADGIRISGVAISTGIQIISNSIVGGLSAIRALVQGEGIGAAVTNLFAGFGIDTEALKERFSPTALLTALASLLPTQEQVNAALLPIGGAVATAIGAALLLTFVPGAALATVIGVSLGSLLIAAFSDDIAAAFASENPFSILGQKFIQGIQPITTQAVLLFSTVAAIFKPALDDLLEGIQIFADSFEGVEFTWITGLANALSALVGGTLLGGLALASSMLSQAGKAIGVLGQALSGLFMAIEGWYTGNGEMASEGLTRFFTGILDMVTGAATGLFVIFANAMDRLLGAVSGLTGIDTSNARQQLQDFVATLEGFDGEAVIGFFSDLAARLPILGIQAQLAGMAIMDALFNPTRWQLRLAELGNLLLTWLPQIASDAINGMINAVNEGPGWIRKLLSGGSDAQLPPFEISARLAFNEDELQRLSNDAALSQAAATIPLNIDLAIQRFNLGELNEGDINALITDTLDIATLAPDVDMGATGVMLQKLIDETGVAVTDPELLSTLGYFGVSINEGIAAGMTSDTSIEDAIATEAQAVTDSWQAALGIQSPATAMIPIGENIIAGILVGMTNASLLLAEDLGLLYTTYWVPAWQTVFGTTGEEGVPSTVGMSIGASLMNGITAGFLSGVLGFGVASLALQTQLLLLRVTTAINLSAFTNLIVGEMDRTRSSVDQLTTSFNLLASAIESIRTARNNALNEGINLSAAPIPAFATGGVSRGGSFIAGERGAELITTNTSMAILNNRTTAAFVAGMRVGTSTNSMAASAPSVPQFASGGMFVPQVSAAAPSVVNTASYNVSISVENLGAGVTQADAADFAGAVVPLIRQELQNVQRETTVRDRQRLRGTT